MKSSDVLHFFWRIFLVFLIIITNHHKLPVGNKIQLMILEVAILNIKTGQESQFEKDFAKAGQYISSVKGYSGPFKKPSYE
jgi:hypothetical protein